MRVCVCAACPPRPTDTMWLLQISLHCTDLKGYVAAWLSGRDSNIVQIIPDSKRDSPAIFTESVFKVWKIELVYPLSFSSNSPALDRYCIIQS